MTHNLSNAEAAKIRKYENVALEVKSIWKLNNIFICTLVTWVEWVITRNFLKYIKDIYLNKNMLKEWDKRQYYYISYGTQIPRTHPLISGDRMTLLPQTDSNPINNLG